MAAHSETLGESVWIGVAGETDARFGNGGLWVGEHSADGDVLVFDPAEADAEAVRLSFYSLTQLRTRIFPRVVATQNIHEVVDDVRAARAKKEYRQRVELRAAFERTRETARVARVESQRQSVIDAHQRYLERLEVPYQGVRKTPADHRPRRRSGCHSCGIALDDFTGSVCVACSDVLCSCGACACGRSLKSR